MRKQDFLGWVIVVVFGAIGGLAGTIFFAVWFIGCGDETFVSAEVPLSDPDSGRERILIDGGEASINDAASAPDDGFDVKDSSKPPPYDPPCSPDADIGDAAIANPGISGCFQVTHMLIDSGYSPGSCSAPVDCIKDLEFSKNPLSYICYGGDGGQLADPYGCTSITQGIGNIWWGCCL